MKKLISALILFYIFNSGYACSSPVVGKSHQNIEDRIVPEGSDVRVEPWIENLEIPWSLVFLPDGRALVSERPGRIRLIKGNKLMDKPYAQIEVAHTGEGGLMGLAVHPDFPKEPFIYVMHTYSDKGNLYNKVIRLKDEGEKASFDKIIIDKIPGARFHNGGRLAFGPDRMLYITTGETFDADLAQDLENLGGKILRITPDGNIPEDNPFKGSPVYSYGHRNPQGLAWHPETKDLFSSEHGPSGEFLTFSNDEINIIKKGENYGWPEVIGAAGKKKYTDPLIVWKTTTPPSGMTFYKGDKIKQIKGDLFVATLRSEALIRIRIKTEAGIYKVTDIERWFSGTKGYGRLRDVVEGPDGFLYFLTNNRDGRGTPQKGDDKIYRIVPK